MSQVTEFASKLIDAIAAIRHANDALSELAAQQRKAIARMDSGGLAMINASQREAGRMLADAEESRRQRVGELARSLGLPPGASIDDLSRVLSTHDAALGQELRRSADEARRAILSCQREQRVVHEAATGVMAHLDGLARQVLAKVNKAGLYAATGTMAFSATPRGVDLVS